MVSEVELEPNLPCSIQNTPTSLKVSSLKLQNAESILYTKLVAPGYLTVVNTLNYFCFIKIIIMTKHATSSTTWNEVCVI